MRIGELNRQVSILQPIVGTRSTVGDGEPVLTYSTILKNIWAKVESQIGREQYRDRNRWEVEDIDFTIWYTTIAIEPEYLVQFNSVNYDIKSVIDVGDSHREIKLMTTRHK